MAYLTDKDYTKLAEAVAEDFVSGKIPLNDTVAKLASQMEMTDEQVRRLCEATNNVTFNKLFTGKGKTASAPLVEFDIADAKKVLKEHIKTASYIANQVIIDGYEMRELPDLRHPEEPFNKVAFDLRPEVKAKPEADKRTMRKALDHLRHEKMASDMAYADELTGLRNRFRKVYDVLPFGQFEKQAAAAFGEVAIPVLNELRSLMKLSQVNYDVDKLQKTAGFVDDTTAEMQSLELLIKLADKRSDMTAAIIKLEKALG